LKSADKRPAAVGEDVLSRAKDGDVAAFEEIVYAYEGYVYGLALSLTEHREDAEGRTDTVTTTVIVAQRVSSIKHADLILVMDKGAVIGCGTHDELVASCSIYNEIAESQMGGAILE
jgi:hypothetical protein